MRKILILIAAAMLCTAPAEAQFFKNLGKALDKVGAAVDKVAGKGDTKTATAKTPTTTIIITAKGIGPIKVGMDIEKFPKSVPGLYDKVETGPEGETDDGEILEGILGHFYKDGAEIFGTFSDGPADVMVVDNIDITKESPVRTADGVYFGMPLDEFKAKGWKKDEYGSYSKDGVYVSIDKGKVSHIFVVKPE